MSLNELIYNVEKPWLNVRVNNLQVDGTAELGPVYIEDLSCTSISNSGTSSLEGAITAGSTASFAGAVTLKNATNQLVFQPSGSGNTVSINCLTPSVSTTQTIYDTPSIQSFFKMGVDNTKVITAGTTVVSGPDSGKSIFISNPGSAYAVNLIPVVNGLDFEFFVVAAVSAAITISVTGGGALFSGVLVDASTAKVAQISNKTSIVIGTGANIGDTIRFVSNGSFYVVKVMSSSNGGITAP